MFVGYAVRRPAALCVGRAPARAWGGECDLSRNAMQNAIQNAVQIAMQIAMQNAVQDAGAPTCTRMRAGCAHESVDYTQVLYSLSLLFARGETKIRHFFIVARTVPVMER